MERAFARAKIRLMQRHVRVNDAHQRDIGNVVPLGDHLGADQQIKFAFIERIQRPLKIFVAANRIPI